MRFFRCSVIQLTYTSLVVVGTANFKFPYLDAETERFLYRRKADLESAARLLDNEGTLMKIITKHATKSLCSLRPY
jgi:hypothetical protein